MQRLPLVAAILLLAGVCTAASVRSSDDVDESSQALRHIRSSTWDNFLTRLENLGNRIDQGLDKIKADVKDAWDRFVAWTGRSVRSPDGQPVDVEKRRILPYYPWEDIYFKRDALGVPQDQDSGRRRFSSWDEFLGHVEDVGNSIDLGFDKIKADVKEAWDRFKAQSGRSVRAQDEESSPEKRIYEPPVEWPWGHAGGWKDIYIKRDPLDSTRDHDRNRRLFSSWDEFLGKVENVGNRIDQGIDKIKSDVKQAWDKFVAESGRSVRSDQDASPEKRIYPPSDPLDWPYKPWHDIYYKRDQLDEKRDDNDDDDRERRLLSTWDDFLAKVENVGNRIDEGIDKIQADVKEAWNKFVAETGKRNVRSPVEQENPGNFASPEKRVYHPYDPLNSPPIYLKRDDSDDDKQKRIYPPNDLIDWPYKPWPNDIYFKREEMDEDRARRLLGPFKPIELPYKPWPYDSFDYLKRDQVDGDRARRLFGTWDDFLAKVENVGNRIDQGIDEIKADVKEAWNKFVAESGKREVRSDEEVSSEKRIYPPYHDDYSWPPYQGWDRIPIRIRDEPELGEREAELEASVEKRIYIDEYNWPHKHVGWKDIYPVQKKRAYDPYDNIVPGDI